MVPIYCSLISSLSLCAYQRLVIDLYDVASCNAECRQLITIENREFIKITKLH